jgi:hypothetical protein
MTSLLDRIDGTRQPHLPLQGFTGVLWDYAEGAITALQGRDRLAAVPYLLDAAELTEVTGWIAEIDSIATPDGKRNWGQRAIRLLYQLEDGALGVDQAYVKSRLNV